MEHYGSDFNATGSVMSRGELEEQRRKRGECIRCGQKCFQKKLFKMIPITEHGKVENGRCLNCNPLDAAAAGGVPAVSRPATEADMRRFNKTQNILRSGSGLSTDRPTMHHNGSSQRRRGSIGQNPNMESAPQPTSRRQSNTRRSSSSNGMSARSSRSLSANRSVASDGYVRGDRSMDGDASVVSTSSTSVRGNFAAANDGRGVERQRPTFNNTRPNSSRSISASSYYSRASDGSSGGPSTRLIHHDDEQSDDGHDEYTSRGSLYRRDGGHPSADFARDGGYYQNEYPDDNYHGVDGDPRRDFGDRANIDYYRRSEHETNNLAGELRHEPNKPEVYDEIGNNHIGRGSQGSNQESMGSSGHSYHLRPQYQRDNSLNDYNRSHSMDHSVASFDDGIVRYGHSENEINVITEQNSSGNHHNSDSKSKFADSNSREEYDIMQRLRELNDFREILNILRDYRDSHHIISLGLQVLANLQLTEIDCVSMAELGVVQLILDSMHAFSDLVDLQISGCRAIWNISFTTSNQLAFVQNGALDILTLNMGNYALVADLQEQALSVLANLGAVEENLAPICEKGITGKIADAMNKHINDANVQIRGCLAMANLASHHSPLKEKLMQDGAGSAIVISMVMHPLNPDLQEKALRALRNLSAQCDLNRLELTNIGGIDAIVSAMQVHRDVPGVQEAGAWTLSYLAGNSDSRILIADCGGIDVTIRAMWVHSSYVPVQEWCCRALFTLSLEPQNRSMILDAGGIAAIVHTMQARNDSAAIQEMGCAVLFNLASDLAVKMRIVDEEALDAVVLAMVLHCDDEKVQERACHLLLQLSINENFKAMQASNVAELVKAAADKFPDSCAEPSDRLLHVIDGYVKEYEERIQAS
jgi:hypothetical protein